MLLFNKRALSVALSTMIITAGVVAMGITILYWAYSWGNIANMQYSDNVTTGSSAIEEKIAFELITYSNLNEEVRINIINWGKANNISIARVYIWSSYYQKIEFSNNIVLMNMTTNSPISGNNLNIGDEGYFIVKVTSPLSSNSYYSVRVVTERGRNFEGSFVAP